MKSIRLLACAALLAGSNACFAAAPLLKVSKSITIDAPATTVWAKAGNFAGLDQWHPAVEKDELISGKNNVAGAVRHLTLKGGGDIKEKLLRYSAKHRYYRYTIVEGALPVSDYHSKLSVKADGADKSIVTWSGTFKRKDTGAHPADDANDKTATDTIAGVYQSGLDNLKKLVEQK
ncbi:MAG: SRPBCC family protein [Gammaproteobacteria bacterium]|nr:SRPBCC family protein [Gammaproteobacteria bacterium]